MLYSHGRIIYIIILKLSAHPPHSVLVPCISIDPGPSQTTATPYKIVILFNPEKLLNDISFDNLYKINSPANIKPKLLSVFTGSLKGPPLILSHQREASPINEVDSNDCIN